jgi:hypothetical protein
MNETVKTLTFMVVALVALAAGVVTHLPRSDDDAAKNYVGQTLFEPFKPETAKSLEITEYVPDSPTPVKHFKVAQEKGVWVIPSKEDYPADASQQLGEAASAIMNATKLDVLSDDPRTHETYGVIDPADAKKLAADADNVGKRVTMADRSGKKLADLIIGKAVKEKPDQRYVRLPGQDAVLVASIKTDKLSGRFQDWIEKDLLKLNSWDVKRVAIDDYSVDLVRQVIDLRTRIALNYDDTASKWELGALEVFNREAEAYEPEKLADDEEINAQKVNDLKTALDDLQIVGVRRKPAGLAADLKVGEELLGNQEQTDSLARSGFYLFKLGDGPREIHSNEGEVRCGTKDGIEYKLRFGSLAALDDVDNPAADKTKPEGEAGADSEDNDSLANRYIMLTVDFNEELIPKPELQPLPGESPGNEAKPAGEETEKTSRQDSPLSAADGLLAFADGDDAGESGSVDGNPLATDDDAGEAKSASKKPAAKKPAAKSAKSGKSAKADAAKSAPKKPKTPAELERERIEKDNERKQKEYDDKVEKGREKAKGLSDRFADWYYVISNDTYKKIHLGRNDIIKEKAPAPGSKPDETDDILSEEEKGLPGQ